jgi:hypothetical protein
METQGFSEVYLLTSFYVSQVGAFKDTLKAYFDFFFGDGIAQ